MSGLNGRMALSLGTDGLVEVCLSRPDKTNALDPAMFGATATTLAQLRGMDGLSVGCGVKRSKCVTGGAGPRPS